MSSFCGPWLRGIEQHVASLPLQRVLISKAIPQDLHTVTNKKTAAVLIPLCNRNGQASVLFTVRTHTVSTHKGQVAFPGGHIDQGETAIEAALRETREELGEGIGKIHVIGLGQTVPSITGAMVTPVLAFVEQDVGDLGALTPSVDEVSTVFTRSINELSDPNLKVFETYTRQGKEFQMPVFGPQTEHRIWGLTAMILEGVLSRAILPHRPVDPTV